MIHLGSQGLVRRLALLLVVVLLAAIGLTVSIVVVAGSASAVDEPSKEQWQSDYRALRQDIARHERNAKKARHNYERAQRRTYPRGDARKQYLLDEKEAKEGIIELHAEIERLRDRGRREGALPGWFYEVDDEPLTRPEPAAPQGPTPEELEDREGRNPIYLEDDDA